MDAQPLKYPQWQVSLFDALLEIRPLELNKKAEKAEAVMVDRLRVLSSTSDHYDERRAIEDALATVRLLR
jgi:hypothetical protein